MATPQSLTRIQGSVSQASLKTLRGKRKREGKRKGKGKRERAGERKGKRARKRKREGERAGKTKRKGKGKERRGIQPRIGALCATWRRSNRTY